MKQQTGKLDLAFPGGAKAQKEFKALSKKLQAVAAQRAEELNGELESDSKDKFEIGAARV
jgi:hypothetical protein